MRVNFFGWNFSIFFIITLLFTFMELSNYILGEMENKLPDIRFPINKKETKTIPEEYSCPKFAVISQETLPYLSMIPSNEKINMKSFKIHKINRYKNAAELTQSKINFYSKNQSTNDI